MHEAGRYGEYVTMAYGVALLVYGGMTLWWQYQARRARRQLAEAQAEGSGQHGE